MIYRHLPCPLSAEPVEEVLQLLLSDARIADALNRKKKTYLQYLGAILLVFAVHRENIVQYVPDQNVCDPSRRR